MSFDLFNNAVVFDDVYNEAEPLITVLNNVCIPTIYINFSKDTTLSCKINSTRLVFVDLVLGDLTTQDEKLLVEPIRKSVYESLDDSNGPFILVIWSKHNNLTETFVERLREANENFNFFYIMLDKNNYFEKNGNLYKPKSDTIFEDIQTDILTELESKLGFFQLFLEWEIHQAQSVSKVIDSFYENNKEEKTRYYLVGLLKAVLGKSMRNVDNIEKQKAFYEVLNSIIYNETFVSSRANDKFSEINYIDNKNFDIEVKLELNSRLLTTSLPDVSHSKYPGNVFELFGFKSFVPFIKNQISEKTNYLNQLYGFSDDDVKELSSDEKKEICGAVKANSIPIMLEITPYCDFAQDKQKSIKLVFGYLFPYGYSKYLWRRKDNLYISEEFNYKDSPYHLILNYKYILYLNKNSFDKNIKNKPNTIPILRVRKEVLNHIQHRYGYFSSRLGVTAI